MTKESIDEYIGKYKEAILNLVNDLAYIDRLDDVLCPNSPNDESWDIGMTPEQEKEYNSLKEYLYSSVCQYLPRLVRKDEKK